MSVEWSKDGSAALVAVGGKWGTISATLFELKEGRVVRRSDLLAAVTRALAAKFPKGKVRPINDQRLFLTKEQQQNVFVLSLVFIPGAFVILGMLAWWRRR